jgi:hypothetical protein
MNVKITCKVTATIADWPDNMPVNRDAVIYAATAYHQHSHRVGIGDETDPNGKPVLVHVASHIDKSSFEIIH